MLASHFEERGDARAETARGIRECDDMLELVRLLTPRDQHEAACLFAQSALRYERDQGRDPAPCMWAAIEAKRAWLVGKITRSELRDVRQAARMIANESVAISPCLSAVWATLAAQAAAVPLALQAVTGAVTWAWGTLTEGIGESNSLRAEVQWQACWIMERAWASAGESKPVKNAVLRPIRNLTQHVERARQSKLISWIDAKCRANPENGTRRLSKNKTATRTRLFAIHLLDRIRESGDSGSRDLLSAEEHGWQRFLATLIEESDALSSTFAVVDGVICFQNTLTEQEIVAIQQYVHEEYHPPSAAERDLLLQRDLPRSAGQEG